MKKKISITEYANLITEALLLVEKWRDADTLAAHGKQPHYTRLGELKAEFVNETVIEKFVLEG